MAPRENIIATIKQILKAHGVPAAYLFGSFAREECECNDIDIAIEPPAGKFSLLDLIGIQHEIEDETRMKVDLVMLRSLKPSLKSNIERDMVAVL